MSKEKTLKVMTVKLSLADRKLVARLQKVHNATFSDLVRTALHGMEKTR